METENDKAKKIINIIAIILVTIFIVFTVIYIGNDLFLSFNFEKMHPDWNVGYVIPTPKEVPKMWFTIEKVVELHTPLFRKILLISTAIFIIELLNKKSDMIGLTFGVPLLLAEIDIIIKAIINFNQKPLDSLLIIILVIILSVILWKIIRKKINA